MRIFRKKEKKKQLVEILNISSDQFDSIWSQQCISKEETIARVNAIIGMRYFVDEITSDGDVYLEGWNHGGHIHQFKKTQLKFL